MSVWTYICCACPVILLQLLFVPVASAPLPAITECQQDLTTVWHLILFFATNYAAHAATNPSYFDSQVYVHIWRLKAWLSWPVICALFLPYGGAYRSSLLMMAMVRMSYIGLDEVSVALVSGAMLVVARTTLWTPPIWPEEVPVQLPEEFFNITESEAEQISAKFVLDDSIAGVPTAQVEPDKCDVFGGAQLPDGYELRCLSPDLKWISAASNAKVLPPPIAFAKALLRSNVEDTAHIKLCRPRRWMKALLSVVQLVSASITLYNTRGDQLSRFGYAAYGLSVIPYALMSFINLLCNISMGEWPCRYVLRTAILEEAMRRTGSRVDGAVGTVREVAPESTGADMSAPERPHLKDGYTLASLSVELPETEKPSVDDRPKLVVSVGDFRRKFRFDPDAAGGDAGIRLFNFKIADLNDRIFPSALSPEKGRGWGIIGNIPSERTWIWWGYVFADVLCILLPTAAIFLPYVIINFLTGYKAQSSTVAERAWMTSWLVYCAIFTHNALVIPVLSAPILTSSRCQKDLTIIWDLILFFITNYVAHAATTPGLIGTLDPAVYIGYKTWISIPSIFALFLPYGGLVRSICIMVGISSLSPFGLDEVTMALLSGTIVLVARDPRRWQPSQTEELIWVKLPAMFHDITDEEASRSLAQFKVEGPNFPVVKIDSNKYNMFGETVLPPGYLFCSVRTDVSMFIQPLCEAYIKEYMLLVRGPQASTIRPDMMRLGFNNKEVSADHVGAIRNLLRSNLISAIVTLYASWGDQISRFGYAVYGLSVIPYALMSLVNLLCNLSIGDMSCRYVLHTGVCAEAAGRNGARLHGMVASTVPRALAETNSIGTDSDPVDTADPADEFVFAFLSIEESEGPDVDHKVLAVRSGGTIKRFKLHSDDTPVEGAHTFHVSSINNYPLRTPRAPVAGAAETSPPKWAMTMLGSIMTLLYLPYIVLSLLTGFQANNSTLFERESMIFWLVFDCERLGQAHYFGALLVSVSHLQ
ncbi:hypothetical protein POSPLADRAFT_1048794 [Postia placenta MAD-698-R-SB12]|uniref:Uncharacterized protein n=1 Tax=Postia placenta MAD-698-R-SB12 TaxID=670580 RepID=A0A1X6MT89_9APHY|nr:hypothetical protein POSPLADRAFT_1048794 [Postia placenta MAD-698-R-SB12]OSX59480.1 hypothetical protein POSPLADRAFT_1048794 [Postia placenta MAD-698-R-SB12]